MSVTIFFCYAREDEALLNKLKTHLRPLQRQNLIAVWHDREISAGTEWEKEISKHLNVAQIILLLVSPDFMDSDYCYGVEMKRAMERHEQNEARVIPVILDHVYWQVDPLNKLQALPTDGKPVMSASWHSLNEALFDVVEGIRKIITTPPAQVQSAHIPQSQKSDQVIEEKQEVYELGHTSFEEETLSTYVQSLAKETHFTNKRVLAEQMRDFIEENAEFFERPEQAEKLLTIYDQAIQAASKGPDTTYYGSARNILIKQKAKCLELLHEYKGNKKN